MPSLSSYVYQVVIFFSVITLTSCSGGGGGPPVPVNVSWDANRETAVNSAGGGYKVYYSTRQGFNITDMGVSVVDVPNAGGPTPTTASFELPSTRYYFRVVAYSALTSPWGAAGSTSAPSAEISLLVR